MTRYMYLKCFLKLTGLVCKYELLWEIKAKSVMFAVCQFGFPKGRSRMRIRAPVVYLGEDPRKLAGE